MFRVGTSTTCPEGQRWSTIKLANGYEVCQISVGITGLVWAVLMIGKAIVRTGVTRENPMGMYNLYYHNNIFLQSFILMNITLFYRRRLGRS